MKKVYLERDAQDRDFFFIRREIGVLEVSRHVVALIHIDDMYVMFDGQQWAEMLEADEWPVEITMKMNAVGSVPAEAVSA